MTKKEFIILPRFDSIEEGVNYVNESLFDFYFSVNGVTYTELGVETTTPDNSEFIPIEGIHLGIYENAQPGELYIENSLIKYYKEDYSIMEE